MKDLKDYINMCINEGIQWKFGKINFKGKKITEYSKKELDDFWDFIDNTLDNDKIFSRIKEQDQELFAQEFYKLLADEKISISTLTDYSNILDSYACNLYETCREKYEYWGYTMDNYKCGAACRLAVINGKKFYDECLKTPEDKKWKRVLKPKIGILLSFAFNQFMYCDFLEKNGYNLDEF